MVWLLVACWHEEAEGNVFDVRLTHAFIHCLSPTLSRFHRSVWLVGSICDGTILVDAAIRMYGMVSWWAFWKWWQCDWKRQVINCRPDCGTFAAATNRSNPIGCLSWGTNAVDHLRQSRVSNIVEWNYGTAKVNGDTKWKHNSFFFARWLDVCRTHEMLPYDRSGRFEWENVEQFEHNYIDQLRSMILAKSL